MSTTAAKAATLRDWIEFADALDDERHVQFLRLLGIKATRPRWTKAPEEALGKESESCDQCRAIVASKGRRCQNKARCRVGGTQAGEEAQRYSKMLCTSHFKQWQRGKSLKMVEAEPVPPSPTQLPPTQPPRTPKVKKEVDDEEQQDDDDDDDDDVFLTPRSELPDEDRRVLGYLHVMNDMVSGITERIGTTERLIERWCRRYEQKVESRTDIADYREAQQRVAELVNECSDAYFQTGRIDAQCVQRVQDYFADKFEPLEQRLHEQLERECNAPGRFRFPDVNVEFRQTLSCDQEDVPEDVWEWYTRTEEEDNLVDKKIYCRSTGGSAVFVVGDALPRDYQVYVVNGTFMGIARRKSKKHPGPSAWPQRIATAALNAMRTMLSAIWYMMRFAWQAIGLTADLLGMIYRSISYRMVLLGMALSAGVLTLSFVTSIGLGPVVLLAYYAEVLCQLVTKPAAAVALSAFIAYGARRRGASHAEYAQIFARCVITMYTFRRYCGFLRYVGAFLYGWSAPQMQGAGSAARGVCVGPQDVAVCPAPAPAVPSGVIDRLDRAGTAMMRAATNADCDADRCAFILQEPVPDVQPIVAPPPGPPPPPDVPMPLAQMLAEQPRGGVPVASTTGVPVPPPMEQVLNNVAGVAADPPEMPAPLSAEQANEMVVDAATMVALHQRPGMMEMVQRYASWFARVAGGWMSLLSASYTMALVAQAIWSGNPAGAAFNLIMLFTNGAVNAQLAGMLAAYLPAQFETAVRGAIDMGARASAETVRALPGAQAAGQTFNRFIIETAREGVRRVRNIPLGQIIPDDLRRQAFLDALPRLARFYA